MDAEIAELESFIDSYVGDEDNEPIATEVFTNSNAKTEDALKDFQKELLEHQKMQDELEDDFLQRLPFVEKWTGQPGNGSGAQDDISLGFSVMHAWNPNFQYGNALNPNYSYATRPYHPVHPSGQLFPHQQQTEGLPPPSFPPYHHPPYAATANHMQGHSVSRHVNSNNAREPYINEAREGVCKNDLRYHLNNKTAGKYSSANGKIPVSKSEWPQRPKGKKNNFSKRRENTTPPNGNSDLSWRKSDHPTPKCRDADRRSVDERSDTSSVDTGEQKNKRDMLKQDVKKKPSSRHGSQSSSSDSVASSASKVLSGKSKAEVRSWIKQDPGNITQIEKQIGKLAYSPSTHLPRLIKSAQSFITNEKKLREVAEMVCSKAMKNSLSAENGAVLCNEMSTRMVNGTSFRTVILNVVQGHFKNRQQLMAATIKNPKNNSWPGFMTFLVELFLNMRTASNERLNTLVNPLFDCFFQTLRENSATCSIMKCFNMNIVKVGTVLQVANPQKTAELISLLRDSCVLPNNLSPEAKCHLLQSLECYARGWKVHALDSLYYDNCSSRTLPAN